MWESLEQPLVLHGNENEMHAHMPADTYIKTSSHTYVARQVQVPTTDRVDGYTGTLSPRSPDTGLPYTELTAPQ
jgi:hypothetical protein